MVENRTVWVRAGEKKMTPIFAASTIFLFIELFGKQKEWMNNSKAISWIENECYSRYAADGVLKSVSHDDDRPKYYWILLLTAVWAVESACRWQRCLFECYIASEQLTLIVRIDLRSSLIRVAVWFVWPVESNSLSGIEFSTSVMPCLTLFWQHTPGAIVCAYSFRNTQKTIYLSG